MEQLEQPYTYPRQFGGFPGTVEQHLNYSCRYNDLGPRVEAAQRSAKAINDKVRMDQAAADGDRMLTGYVAPRLHVGFWRRLTQALLACELLAPDLARRG